MLVKSYRANVSTINNHHLGIFSTLAPDPLPLSHHCLPLLSIHPPANFLFPPVFFHIFNPSAARARPPSHQPSTLTFNPYIAPLLFPLRFRLRKNITGAFSSTRLDLVVSGSKWFLIDSILPVASALSVFLIRSLCAWWSVFLPLVNNSRT